MRRFFVTLISFCIVFFTNAQSDVLYLKNGSIIKGSVLEMDPSNGVKIQTSDGSLFVYSISEVDRVSKDNLLNREESANKVKTYGQIERDKSSFRWKETGAFLTSEEYRMIFDDELYDTFQGAHSQFNTGRTFMGIGIGCLAVACISMVAGAKEKNKRAMEADFALAQLFAFGADVGICLGCVFKGIGKGRLNWIERTYNSGRIYSSNIYFSPSLMLTAQKEFGLGATLTFSY